MFEMNIVIKYSDPILSSKYLSILFPVSVNFLYI